MLRSRFAFRLAVFLLLPCLLLILPQVIAKTSPQESPPQSLPGRITLSVKRDALLNGLDLMTLEQPGTGKVTVHLRIDSGALFDLAGRGGLADVTGGMLLKGTAGLSSKNMADLVSQLGLTVNVSVGWDSTDITISGPSEDFESIMDLLAKMVIRPTFDQKELDAFKTARVSELLSEHFPPAQAALNRAAATLYGIYPYGHPAEGTADSIAKITRDNVVYYHNRFYIPNNSQLCVEGDVTAETVTHVSRSKFGIWEKAPVVPPTFVPPVGLSGHRITIINSKDGDSSLALIAQIGVARSAEDYFAARIAAQLISELAGKQPGAPVAQYASSLDARVLPGPLLVQIKCPSEKMAGAVSAAISSMIAIMQNDISADQLESAKQHLISAFESELNTSAGRAKALLDIEQYKLGRDYLLNFEDRVNAVSAEEVATAARKHFSPGALAIAIVGPSASIQTPMKKIGPVSVLN